MTQPVFRFAPSPNGRLHLGHAYSALLNEQMARHLGGQLLLRIEDIDHERCTPTNTAAVHDDLRWLGIEFDRHILQQSSRMAAYREAVSHLMVMNLLYVCACTRKQLAVNINGVTDPEQQPLYPGTCRRTAHLFGEDSALRLNMMDAVKRVGRITWSEKGEVVSADPSAWGDVIIARKGIGTSYHLSVVVDDAFQGVTDIVRGEDLYHATSIHRLLQVLLGLPEPRYHHHPLIRHDSGRKLAKSRDDRSLADLRSEGVTPEDVRAFLGFRNRK